MPWNSYHERLHQAWPSSRFNSFASKCTSTDLRTAAQVHFVNLMEAACPSHVSIPLLRASIGLPAALVDRTSKSTLIKPRSWFVLPSRVAWCHIGASGHASRCFTKWFPNMALELCDASILSIGISWSLPGNHFGQQVKSWKFPKATSTTSSGSGLLTFIS